MLANITADAGVRPPVRVGVPFVQAPLLRAPGGDVVTLLDSRPGGVADAAIPALNVTVDLGYTPASVVSMEHGALRFVSVLGGRGVTLLLNFTSADMLLFHRNDSYDVHDASS